MQVDKLGSRGRTVKIIQVGLNAHLRPTEPLRIDAIFGPKTDRAVRRFQSVSGLLVDGLVGPETWKALVARPLVIDISVQKFVAQLGTAADFVEHVAAIERGQRTRSAVCDELADFVETKSGTRYLILKGAPRIVDFRHFFAALAETVAKSLSKKMALPIGGNRGDTLLLGVLNELRQCVDEGTHSKVRSCFSREDLGSNRLGAEFGRRVTIASAEARPTSMSEQLKSFLASLNPQRPSEITKVALPGALHTAREGAVSLMTTVLDTLVPDAY